MAAVAMAVAGRLGWPCAEDRGADRQTCDQDDGDGDALLLVELGAEFVQICFHDEFLELSTADWG